MKVLLGGDSKPTRDFTVKWLFEPRDMWVGVFWNDADEFRLVYICLLPCLPIVLIFRKEERGT